MMNRAAGLETGHFCVLYFSSCAMWSVYFHSCPVFQFYSFCQVDYRQWISMRLCTRHKTITFITVTTGNNTMRTDAQHIHLPHKLLHFQNVFSQTIQHPDALLTTARLQLARWKVWLISLCTMQLALNLCIMARSHMTILHTQELVCNNKNYNWVKLQLCSIHVQDFQLQQHIKPLQNFRNDHCR